MDKCSPSFGDYDSMDASERRGDYYAQFDDPIGTDGDGRRTRTPFLPDQ